MSKTPKEAEPEPRTAPPQPMTMVRLKLQKQVYRDWIAAGGTPPIYGNT